MAALDGVIPAIIGAANAAGGDHQVDRSLRFDTDDGAYLNRAPSAPGDKAIWTLSFWIKICNLTVNKQIFTVYSDSSNDSVIRINGNNYLEIYNYRSGSYQTQYISNAQFRDTSSWYHFVISCNDSTSLNAWVNGQAITSWSSSSGPNGVNWLFNSTNTHQIGRYNTTANSNFYLAEVNWIDGQALAETDFGETDDDNNWNPIKYSGSYGTNGFYLKFADNSSNAALGTDSSGNSNTWTVNNLTAAAANANTSQTWSSSSTGYHAGAGSAFDGNLTTSSFATGGASANAYVDITAINASKVEVYISAYGSGSAGAYYYCRQTNGTQHTYTISSSGTSLGWITVYDGSQISINRLGGARNSSGAAGSAQYGWKVDGVLLVDSGTAGFDPAGIDSLIDTPTNYTPDSGNPGGNYCTLNPLQSATTLSNGNLDSAGGSGWSGTAGTFGMSSGKWYFEYDNVVSNEHLLGIVPSTTYTLNTVTSYAYGSETGGKYSPPSSSNVSYGDSWGAGDVIGVAFDADAGNLYFYKNGTVQNSGTAAFTGLTSGPYLPSVVQNGSSRSASLNFGQRPFKYTNAGTDRPASTYLSLCTTNLPDPTIADGSTAFDAKTFTANNGSQSISLGFSPDLVWTKSRANSYEGQIFDTVRGNNQELSPNTTRASRTLANSLTFDSAGFTMPSNNNNANYGSGGSVAWAWDAGTSTVSNTDGSITTSVRANTSYGFSIVKASVAASLTGGPTLGHGLNKKPEFIIGKNIDSTIYWYVFHKDLTDSYYLIPNLSSAEQNSGAVWGTHSSLDSSIFRIGTGTPASMWIPSGTNDCIFYVFTSVEGYSAFGKFSGNSSTDGPFQYCGFKPRFLLLKGITQARDWIILDTARDTGNVADSYLYINSSGAEATSAIADILSNGFKMRYNGGLANQTGEDYIWAAFAFHPFKTARAR